MNRIVRRSVLLTVVSCGPPAPVANAHVTMTDDMFLSNVTYECKPGFRPKPDGDWTRQCQTDKRWSGTAPLCRRTSFMLRSVASMVSEQFHVTWFTIFDLRLIT